MTYGPVGQVPQFTSTGTFAGDGATIRISDPTTGAGILNGNTDPLVVGVDPLTGANAPSGTDMGPSAFIRSAWKRLVLNGDFAIPPPFSALPINSDLSSASYNVLPGWVFTDNSNGAIVLTWGADTGSGSGGSLLWSIGPGAAADEAYIEQLVPIRSTRSRNNAIQALVCFFNGTADSNPRAYVEAQPLKSDAVTTTGTGLSVTGQFLALATDDDLRFTLTNNMVLAADAGYVRLRVGVRRNTGAAGSSYSIQTAEVNLVESPGYSLYSDLSTPATGPYAIYADGGLNIVGPTGNAIAMGVTTVDVGPGLLVRLNGGQLKFPSTQNPSADANTLDDYEEGAWTPTLEFLTSPATSWTFSVQDGSYTKVGNTVFFTCRVQASTWTKGAAAGNFQIKGLPFTASGSIAPPGNAAGIMTGYTKAGFTTLVFAIQGSQTYALMNASGSAQTITNLAAGDFTTATVVEVRAGGVYYV